MTALTELTIVKCWCGICHAIPEALDRTATNNGETVYCPLGHKWVRGNTKQMEIDALKLEIQTKDNLLAEERARVNRLEKRARHGVCAFCKRSFPNMRAHMNSKHK